MTERILEKENHDLLSAHNDATVSFSYTYCHSQWKSKYQNELNIETDF